jgi:2-C-methyl-D-erythritol 4-phosphate cytidylyltransferase
VRWCAIVVAAGRGTRFGQPKQFIELAGLPMVGWSLRTFASMGEVGEVVIVTEAMWLERMQDLAATLVGTREVRIVEGGETRQASVYNGLLAVPKACEAVFVHDGARPLVRARDVRAGMNEVSAGIGAVLAAPVVDTIKVVDRATRRVGATLDRNELWAAQTPQFATRDDLLRAHEHARRIGLDATDDAALLETAGIEVVVVPATGENFKVTHPNDVARAEAMLGVRI